MYAVLCGYIRSVSHKDVKSFIPLMDPGPARLGPAAAADDDIVSLVYIDTLFGRMAPSAH